jgi:hypothetical protein
LPCPAHDVERLDGHPLARRRYGITRVIGRNLRVLAI